MCIVASLTLTDILAKSVAQGNKDWDQCLPYLLFTYQSSLQSSIGESPFYLLYGRRVDVTMIGRLLSPFGNRVGLGKVRLCPAKIPDQSQQPTIDAITNSNSTKDVKVCVVDDNAKEHDQRKEDNREESPSQGSLVMPD